jgi:hypothetical protein
MRAVRFHGRGGQGAKTASRILGTAAYLEGFMAQDSPIYGAVDGYLEQRPQLEADTAAFIASLNPQSPDLRNPKVLHLKSDKQRRRAIRVGHPGTGMFPDKTMTDQGLADTIAYLSMIRREGSVESPSPSLRWADGEPPTNGAFPQ